MPKNDISTLFITDDDADDRGFLAGILQKRGFNGKVEQLANGAALLERLDVITLDGSEIIVLDLNMPVKNGFETLEALKADVRFANLPVIVFSATSRKEDEVVCMKMGCTAFLQKPLTYSGYERVVDAIVSGKGMPPTS
ncbi:response regulator [Segetibacter sp. 3557_3]|uniref:response regulator n=1 Tax=Segetibacter sp. 3557_3 TaxID=2547429 RepID=UPI001058468B|nr:response regulator [Segetibacter sp. 3557_3]